MKYTFLGFKHVDFVTEKGETIKGYKLYLSEPVKDALSGGTVPFSSWFSESYWGDFVVTFGGPDGLKALAGKPCDAVFNRYGKVESLVFGK